MKSMLNKQALACALLACAAGAQAEASAAPTLEALKAMAPAQRDAAFRQLAATKAPAGSKMDSTPPVLTSFKITPPADVAAPLSQLRVDLTATDDLSGIAWTYANVSGPHAQNLSIFVGDSLPAKSVAAHGTVDTTAYLEPGAWTVNSIGLVDVAGNSVWVTGDELAALGDPHFQLANSHPDSVDYTPPTLKGGKVLTPRMSVSAVVKGTRSSAYVVASFAASDAAGGAGIYSVDATWCFADNSFCFGTSNWESSRGQSKATLQTASSLGPSYLPGEYILASVVVRDQAANYTYLFGTEFGGTTDFSTLMPQGHVITLVP
jgi:hypothetical protein